MRSAFRFAALACLSYLFQLSGQDCCASMGELSFGGTFRFLYMQPTSSNSDYAALAFPLPLASPNWQIEDLKSDYHPAYEIALHATDDCNSTTFEIDYFHFQSKDTASKFAGDNNMIGPFFEIGPDSLLYTQAKAKERIFLDEGYLNYGTSLSVNDNFSLNLFAGVAAMHLKKTLKSGFSNASGTVARSITTPTSYWGVGPQLGLDFTYSFCENFGIVGEGKTALFVGNMKDHTNYSSIAPEASELGIPQPNKQSTKVHSRTQVVPALEGKIGLAYSFCAFCIPMEFEAGYEVRYYINALQSVDIGSEVNTPPVTPDTIGVFARTFHRTLSNFALAGPYVALSSEF